MKNKIEKFNYAKFEELDTEELEKIEGGSWRGLGETVENITFYHWKALKMREQMEQFKNRLKPRM